MPLNPYMTTLNKSFSDVCNNLPHVVDFITGNEINSIDEFKNDFLLDNFSFKACKIEGA